MGSANARDAFMNYAAWATVSADLATLRSGTLNTGLSIRGGLAWLLHKVEAYLSTIIPITETDQSESIQVAVSTIPNQAGIPDWTSQGTVDYWNIESNVRLTTSGAWQTLFRQPLESVHLPPVPLASPQLVGYAISDRAHTAAVTFRVQFTTQTLDQALYQEIAEVWGW